MPFFDDDTMMSEYIFASGNNMHLDWEILKDAKLPRIDPNKGGWVAERQTIVLWHGLIIHLNPPAPSLHGFKVGRLGKLTIMSDKDAPIGIVISQFVKIKRSKAKKLGLI